MYAEVLTYRRVKGPSISKRESCLCRMAQHADSRDCYVAGIATGGSGLASGGYRGPHSPNGLER
jgi:hypothetical protein